MYMRKYKFVPPAGCYVLFLCLNYSIAPNPVWSSFGSTMVLNFLLMAWFTLSFMQSQSNAQQVISSLHMKNTTKFFISHYFFLLLLSLFLSLTTVCFPVLIGAFDQTIGVDVLLFALFNHVVITFLSATIAMLFSKNMMRKPGNSWLGVVLTLVVLLAIASVGTSSSFSVLNYILPPIAMLLHIMNEGMASIMKLSTIIVYLLSIFYSMALMIIGISIVKKKDILWTGALFLNMFRTNEQLKIT